MTAQLWRCPSCGGEYWSPMSVSEVMCAGVHTPGGRKRMKFVAEGPEVEKASPFREEAVTTVRRGSRKEG